MKTSDSDVKMMTPGLAEKLRELKTTLSPEDAAAFSSMINLAVAQAHELKAQRAADVVGGAAPDASDQYLKPPSHVTTMAELDALTDLNI